jgi:hypothetical protein
MQLEWVKKSKNELIMNLIKFWNYFYIKIIIPNIVYRV